MRLEARSRHSGYWILLGLVLVCMCALVAWQDRRAAPGAGKLARPRGATASVIPQSFAIGDGAPSRSEISAATVPFLAAGVESVSDRLHRWRAAVCAGPLISKDAIIREELSTVFSSQWFRRTFPTAPSFLFKNNSLWSVRPKTSQDGVPDPSTEAHVDQFLASCAETGIPLTQTIVVDGANVTVDALVDGSRANFVADQDPCWSAVAYCLYRPDEPEWVDRFGDRHSYEGIANSLMNGPIDAGPCGGSHRHIALAMLLQTDKRAPFLTSSGKGRIEAFLQSSSRILERSQHRSGSWGANWAHPEAASASGRSAAESSDLLMLVTGHHLEWAATTEPRNRPSEAALAAASQFLLQAVQGRTRTSVDAYCGWSHAIRSLWLIDEARH
jgi:hypothetical protein